MLKKKKKNKEAAALPLNEAASLVSTFPFLLGTGLGEGIPKVKEPQRVAS